MHSVSTTYNQILATQNHWFERKINIAGTDYGENAVEQIRGTGALFTDIEAPIGNCIARDLSFVIQPTTNTIPKMAAVAVYIRACSETAQSEWICKGHFFIAQRTSDAFGRIKFTCYDAMLKGTQKYLVEGDVDDYPKPMSTVVSEICTRMGLTQDARNSISSSYTIDYPNDLTMLEVLGQIAVAHGGNWTITDDGYLYLCPLVAGTGGSTAIDRSAFSLEEHQAPAGYDRVIMWYGDDTAYRAPEVDDATWDAMTGRILECDCLYATQAMATALLGIVSGYTYRGFKAKGAYMNPAAELGDSITVNGYSTKVYGVENEFGGLMACTVSAPSIDETEDEYPYLTPTQLALQRRVTLGQPYYGVTITRQNGIEIKRSDGESEAIFNSDKFEMSAKIDGVMKPRLYFDPSRGDFVFDGLLDADALVTDALYAEQGDIAELTVDRLSTSRRVRLYNLRNTADDNYLEIQDNYLRLITGSVITSGGVAQTEQATNRFGRPLYWQKVPDHINSAGYPEDENNVQIYATTDEPIVPEGGSLDDYKVIVYQYSELTKAELAFFNESGTYVPKMVMGAGDNQGRTKGILHKSANGFDISFTDSNGDDQGILMNSSGYMDLYGLRKPTELDFSGWGAGYFSEELDGQQTASWLVDFDSQGRPILFTDGDGHETAVVW